MLGEKHEHPFGDEYKDAKGIDDIERFPTARELRAAWKQTTEPLQRALEGLTEERLAAAPPYKFPVAQGAGAGVDELRVIVIRSDRGGLSDRIDLSRSEPSRRLLFPRPPAHSWQSNGAVPSSRPATSSRMDPATRLVMSPMSSVEAGS